MIRLIAQITLKFAGKEDQKVYKKFHKSNLRLAVHLLALLFTSIKLPNVILSDLFTFVDL